MENILRKYLQTLNKVELETFVRKARTTIASVNGTARAHRDPDRKLRISPEYAARLEQASEGVLSRAQLSNVCRMCPYVTKEDA